MHPTPATVAGAIKLVDKPNCEVSAIPTSSQVSSLTQLLARRELDPALIRVAYLLTRCLDGGEREDVYRALGKVLATRPRSMLRMLADESVTDKELTYIIASPPLELVDNVHGQIRELERREARVRSASEERTAELSQRALKALASRRTDLLAIQKQIASE